MRTIQLPGTILRSCPAPTAEVTRAKHFIKTPVKVAASVGAPHALFKAITVSAPAGTYTASSDGKKFVVNAALPQSVNEPLTLITNWPADLK
jgi:hypothetical protein